MPTITAPRRAKSKRRRDLTRCAQALTVAAAILSCKTKVSSKQCDELIDHFAELVVREHFPDAGAAMIEAERQRERAEAKGDELRNCPSEVQTEEHSCAMRASTPEGVLKCLE